MTIQTRDAPRSMIVLVRRPKCHGLMYWVISRELVSMADTNTRLPRDASLIFRPRALPSVYQCVRLVFWFGDSDDWRGLARTSQALRGLAGSADLGAGLVGYGGERINVFEYVDVSF